MSYIRTKEAQEIINGVQSKNRDLTYQNAELQKLTEEAATCKRDFLIAMTTKTFELKSTGTSVTLIRDLVKGDKAIADLQFKWDVSEGVLMACRERIKDLRESIGTYRSILTWLRTELELTPTQEG